MLFEVSNCAISTLKIVFIQRESDSVNTQFHLKINKILFLFQPIIAVFQKFEIFSSPFLDGGRINGVVS